MSTIDNLYYKVSRTLTNHKEAIQDLFCELLKMWGDYGMKEIELSNMVLPSYLSSKDNLGKPTLIVDPGCFINSITDCFIVVYPDGKKISLSDLKVDICLLDWITRSIDFIAFNTETNPYKKYPDFSRKKIHFSGESVVITDPCYCLPEETRDDQNYEMPPLLDDYGTITEKSLVIDTILEYYKNQRRFQRDLEEYNERNRQVEKSYEDFGIRTYIDNSTLYGDWSCTVFKQENNEVLGEFCADSGRVGVFKLSEILKCNPGFKTWATEHPRCVTILENFTGDVWMELQSVSLDLEYNNYEVCVIGEGNINFISRQTGM